MRTHSLGSCLTTRTRDLGSCHTTRTFVPSPKRRNPVPSPRRRIYVPSPRRRRAWGRKRQRAEDHRAEGQRAGGQKAGSQRAGGLTAAEGPSKEAEAIEDEAMEPTFITLIMLSFITFVYCSSQQKKINCIIIDDFGELLKGGEPTIYGHFCPPITTFCPTITIFKANYRTVQLWYSYGTAIKPLINNSLKPSVRLNYSVGHYNAPSLFTMVSGRLLMKVIGTGGGGGGGGEGYLLV